MFAFLIWAVKKSRKAFWPSSPRPAAAAGSRKESVVMAGRCSATIWRSPSVRLINRHTITHKRRYGS